MNLVSNNSKLTIINSNIGNNPILLINKWLLLLLIRLINNIK